MRFEKKRMMVFSGSMIDGQPRDRGPPTLVVEVLSRTTTSIDRSTKRQLYARYGVPYYWIIDSVARTIEAYRPPSRDMSSCGGRPEMSSFRFRSFRISPSLRQLCESNATPNPSPPISLSVMFMGYRDTRLQFL
jgi:hypothetical protein